MCQIISAGIRKSEFWGNKTTAALRACGMAQAPALQKAHPPHAGKEFGQDFQGMPMNQETKVAAHPAKAG